MKTTIKRTNSENIDFINLVKKLDAYLKLMDGEEHAFYNQYNTIAVLKNVVVIYVDEKPIGCGAVKKFDSSSMEVKRMYVRPENRGNGMAQKLLSELEIWSKEMGYKKCVLETGKRQVEAVQFYKKCNYEITPNYGQYKNIENSICFEKTL
ncbi:GNAT family N-acetyltransferase [Polaribacter sp.]|uniref:GNAT family N-acetyltransferase n=1 Tax=Polaribacter sp. TaxID=1920175 RepID=UPI003EF4CC88